MFLQIWQVKFQYSIPGFFRVQEIFAICCFKHFAAGNFRALWISEFCEFQMFEKRGALQAYIGPKQASHWPKLWFPKQTMTSLKKRDIYFQHIVRFGIFLAFKIEWYLPILFSQFSFLRILIFAAGYFRDFLKNCEIRENYQLAKKTWYTVYSFFLIKSTFRKVWSIRIRRVYKKIWLGFFFMGAWS